MQKRSAKMFANGDRPNWRCYSKHIIWLLEDHYGCASRYLVGHNYAWIAQKMANGYMLYGTSNSTCMSLLNTVHIILAILLTMKDRMTMVVVTFGHSQYGGWTYSSLSSTGLRMVNFLLASSVLPRARMARLIFCSNWGRALCWWIKLNNNITSGSSTSCQN